MALKASLGAATLMKGVSNGKCCIEIDWVADVKSKEERTFALGVANERQAKIDREKDEEVKLAEREVKLARREEQDHLLQSALGELQSIIIECLDPRHVIKERWKSVDLGIYGPRGGTISFKLSDNEKNITPDILEDFENAKCPISVFVYQSSNPAPLCELIIQCKSIWPLYPNIEEMLVLPSTKDLRYFLGRLSVVIDPEIPNTLEYYKRQQRLLERIHTIKYGLIVAAVILLSIYLT
jgi:hypothetical protein